MEKLSVRGYVEVLRALREIIGIRRGIARRILAERPDLFIGVDSSGLQPRPRATPEGRRHPDRPLREPARSGPGARWRVQQIARSVERMLVMFPFEEALYERPGSR